MFKSSTQTICYIAIVLCIIAVESSQGQLEEQRVVERDSLALTIPNPFGETPFLETNDQNGRYLGIHIPWIYDFGFHWRDGGGLGNMKLDQTILSGLASYTYDKAPAPDSGDLQGPTKFSILGLPLWDNGEQPVSQDPAIQA